MDTAENSLRHVRSRIENACRRCGRKPDEITLIGASKTVSGARLPEFYDAGLRDCGENYVQEAARKMDEIALSSTRYRDWNWHFIGALQSNKARDVVGKFALIHSVDRLSLAQSLDKAACKIEIIQDVLLQVNIGDETTKAGCAVDELSELAHFCGELKNLNVRGLMCLPPASENIEDSRVHFCRLRELRDELRASSTRSCGSELSMGMSGDFEVAIEEGATLIRLGTALFGARN